MRDEQKVVGSLAEEHMIVIRSRCSGSRERENKGQAKRSFEKIGEGRQMED